MIDEICRSINNFFAKDKDKFIGDFSIVNGELVPQVALNARLIRITGSSFNDGVHYAEEALIDETFHGSVWVMSPPQSFLDLVDEIEKWNEKNSATATSPFISESFGGYSYTKGNAETSWQSCFKAKLNLYRKARL